MDYYSFDSEVIESLNLLRPPVKRDRENRNKDFSVYNSCTKNNLKVLRRFGHTLTANRLNSCKQTRHEDSSTSLILKKTSESQIYNQYSGLNYTGLHCQEQSFLQKIEQQTDTSYIENQRKHKPLIQVTVIPKSDQNPGSKLFSRQRVITNTVQATSSYHENSIQTKNVYLVVAGRKKDKIYEIKTTGSEKFEKEPVGDEAIKNFCNFKQFIKTLNMERKRKKDKKKNFKIGNKNETLVNDCENKESTVKHVCNCMPDNLHDVKPGRSRVRIFGRIGLTEDDKYVLKCQATVDDKPVPTSLSTVEKQLSSSSLAAYNRNDQATCQKIDGMERVRGKNIREDFREDDIRSQRDSIMQTDFSHNAVNELLLKIDNKNRIRKDSQSTQVNFNKPNGNSTMIRTNPFRTSDQATRCNCSNDYPVIKTVDNGYDGKNLKPCQSPLVIISVFPKQDNNLADLVKTVQCAQIDNSKRSSFPENVQCAQIDNSKRSSFPENVLTKDPESKTEMTKNKNEKKSSRSRSPSPKGQKTKSKLNKTVETKRDKAGARSVSPPRSKLGKKDSKKSTNSSKQTLQFFNSNTKKVGTDKKRKPSPPRSPRAKTPPATPKAKEPQTKNFSRQNLKPKVNNKPPKRKVDIGINTEHLKTKKALVDSYTNKITEQMKSNKGNLIESISRVSVNIDSETEYYDVSFRKDKFSTDLNVRKTVKEASAQKSFDENQQHGSMENFFPNMSQKHRRSSACRPSTCAKLNLSDDFKSNAPRLTLRDSLEIGHRLEGYLLNVLSPALKFAHKREDNVIKNMQTSRPNSDELSVNRADMEFLAPIKHYTGDDCTICDPVERDREIRQLLGVGRRRNKLPYKDLQIQQFEMEGKVSRHCFYSKQCKNTFVTAFAANNTCACSAESESDDDVIDVNNKTEHLILADPEAINQSYPNPMKYKSGEDQCNLCKKCAIKHRTASTKPNPAAIESACPCNACNVPTCERNNQTQSEANETELPNQNSNYSNEYIDQDNEREEHETELEQNVADLANKTDAERNNLYPYQVPNLDQTSLYQQLTLNRNIQIFLQIEQFAKQKPIVLSRKQYAKIKRIIQHTVGKDRSKKCVCNRSIVSIGPKFEKTIQKVLVYANRQVQTDLTRRETAIKKGKRHGKNYKKTLKKNNLPKETIVLFSNQTRGSCKATKPPKEVVRRAASSLEIRNASVAYWKHVTFSSTNVGSIGSSSFAHRNMNSIQTIFRGHKKSVTPNLGTSAFSLLSEAHISESQSMKLCSPDKTKRPLLKRLMSCLVSRSKSSEKIGPGPGLASYSTRVNSSEDSYHISSSLGAIEMSSSIYDTSASFYSNHSIHPLSSKLKRSFFDSVRGFLTSRKS